ncbi:FAD dependent oxidoreductase, putative [marine gamma proteobacterium HTCC2148]|jgi:phytoene dehydrogenase-like protein|uniref:Pyridine nucleotide-disulfide oxidoreductase domain-containing protein 2 n=1 Tax=Candidatus Seongchinamella marina TaxID=2518990 RepID=A0ABT3SWY4_9GAMM|nr:NAD(P)/FAD-dependent oxidoreductase [Candidatus Seongchinamella marina]EEB79133.1 FAD dependent oxidoreductase, putative [marine gamma proteobacterium HTCC2148]MBT3411814.1 NAD(P)/FAD-dependent oxidoreductase [Halieaceae bacterium]MBT7720090.1 NAD(P)/FAD-dependent oxidoreductase [Halieaceae bacterium]MCX2974512.1 NAD(P)/FAD-dependent oxidoreductase [Candidatus Seongchinamella marina]
MKKYDAIIIGAGHNGLTNAAYLARAGLDTLVLEKNDYIGGAAVTREMHDGWFYSSCSYVCSMMRQAIHRDLDLSSHGLLLVPYLGTVNFGDQGQRLIDYRDEGAAYNELRRHSPHDADAMFRFQADLGRYAQLIRKTLLRTPPDPTSFKPRDIKELLFLAKEFWSLGEKELYEYVRFFTMSAAEFLEDYFENDLIKAAMASPGIIGTALGVYSPGSAYILLHHVMGDVDGSVGAWGLARGGMGAISNALCSAMQAAGGEVRTGAGVEQIIVKDGKACGVALESGEELYAGIIVSNLDAKRTFTKVVDRKDLPPGIYEKANNFKIRGSSGKVNIALSGMPTFSGVPDNRYINRGGQGFCGSLETMERAYDCWKRGRWSDDPFVESVIPSAWDPTVAPPGKHWMSNFVQYCPPELADGPWTPEKRDAFGQSVVDKIARYSPDFKDLIVHMEVRTPHEIENEVGLTEGNIFQGELTIDQLLFNRPFPGYGQYRMPVKNMYMCGSSTHPGGGVSSACGANAAREILLDLKRPNTVPQDDCYDE